MKLLSRLKYPLIVAPMAGGPSSVELVAEASSAGALGSFGAAYSDSRQIEGFVQAVRARTSNPIAINLFVPHAKPQVSPTEVEAAVEAVSEYYAELGLPPPNVQPPFEQNFEEQFEACLRLKPAALSFIFGLPPEAFALEARKAGIELIGTATTFAEAQALEEAKVDAIVLHGFAAGGHRAIFNSEERDQELPLAALLRDCRGKIKTPLVAAGGLMNAAHIRSALELGASAVQMGTAFLCCKEAGTPAPYKKSLLGSKRLTQTTRVYSGRLARGIENRFMREMQARARLPFPAQNKLTRDLRTFSAEAGRADFLSLWSGSGDGELATGSVRELIQSLF